MAWARARFVARIVHRDPASWSAAVADLIRWHSSARDEAAEWPGRAAQEKQVSAAGGDGGEDGDGSVAEPDAAPDAGSGEGSVGGAAQEPAASGSAASGAASTNSKPSGTSG